MVSTKTQKPMMHGVCKSGLSVDDGKGLGIDPPDGIAAHDQAERWRTFLGQGHDRDHGCDENIERSPQRQQPQADFGALHGQSLHEEELLVNLTPAWESSQGQYRFGERKTPPCGGEFLSNIVELNRIELSAS